MTYVGSARLLRCLTSIHIYQEVAPDVFANNRISETLVGNEPLRAYLMLLSVRLSVVFPRPKTDIKYSGLDLFSAADWLPTTMTDPVKGPSYDVAQTAFQSAVGTTETRWDWLEQQIPADAHDFGRTGYPGAIPPVKTSNQDSKATTGNTTNGATNGTRDGNTDGAAKAVTNGAVKAPQNEGPKTKPRPELKIMSMAMVGGGRVTGKAHVYDFPWASLGNGTVVDVGGGVGTFSASSETTIARFPSMINYI